MGQKLRATASTSMNEYSSRSHAILQIQIVGKSKDTATQTFGMSRVYLYLLKIAIKDVENVRGVITK